MKWLNDIVPYRIETERLQVKCWEPKYAKELNDLIISSSESLLPWMPFAKPPFPTVKDEINILRMFRGEYDLNKDYTLGIFDKVKGNVIGSTGLHTRQGKNIFEIGYWIGNKFENNGFATEVASALIKTAFELSDISRVEINTAVGNIKSQKVIQKLGLKFEGVIRNSVIDANGISHDNQKYSILRNEYETSMYKNIILKYYSATNEEIEID